MTTTYNKRPKTRGRVYEANKSDTAPAFIEWTHPGNAPIRFILSLLGMIPLVGLFLTNWLEILPGYLTQGETEHLSKLDLLTSLDTVGATIRERVFTPNDAEAADLFLEQFTAFGWIFTLIAAMMAICIVLTVFSMFACATTKGRAAFAYLGFTVGMATPLVFIYAVSEINRMAGEKTVQTTFYPYLTILAAILALVYCVRYPVLADARNRRNSILTRSVTSFAPVRGDGIRESLRKIIFTIALICFLYFGSTLGVDLFNEWRAGIQQKINEARIGAAVDITDPALDGIRDLKPLPDYLELYRLNNDTVGYIRLNDTKVNYPVLQTTNNRYYLDHDFDGNASKGGAVFADYRNEFEREHGRFSDNTILYGHNISTGNYFAALSNYHRGPMLNGNFDFYKANPVVMFDTLFEKMEWKIFACVLFNTQEEYGEVYPYWHQLDFINEDHFHDFILDVMDRSVMFTDVDLQYGDKILTLSTCYWPYSSATVNVDTRCVVFARKIRDGESRDVNVEAVTANPNALRFELERRRLGGTYSRDWNYKEKLLSYKGD